ncbi:MAG: M81 family metallopeptidase [Pseudomonadota bacterium]|nr:M81 family metallopeptidase [Pseudomonadota bacterium]
MTRRVLSAEIAHETNTFSFLPTTLESYHTRLYYEGDDIARAMTGTASEIAGHRRGLGRALGQDNGGL